MVQRKLLVAYGTSFGQTARIAGRMRELLIAEGFNVTLRELEMSTEIDVDRFDGILIGASIIHGHHQRAVERFARRHRNTLNRVPSAFFSVSGSAASADPRERDTARSLMGSFLASVEWYPDLETTFGGGFPFTRYPWYLRYIMKRITRKEGVTDTSRDHDFTDWSRVEEFTHRFAEVVESDAAVATTPEHGPLRQSH